MNRKKKTNIGHSVFQRLLNIARSQGADFNLLLYRYGMERFLYRLSISAHSKKFILKGASMFLVWKGQNFRVTKDADLLYAEAAESGDIIHIFKEVCSLPIEETDGIRFIPDTISTMPIREEQAYGGMRVTLTAFLLKARIPLQIDIGFGDIVTPAPEAINYPTLLDAPHPVLLAYPRYTVVAEKLEAMVRLSMANSRMKDFYDVWLMSRLFEFEGQTLCKAIQNTTFRCRSMPLPKGQPTAFTFEFRKDAQKQIQWRAFIRNSKPENVPKNLEMVIERISDFLMPVMDAAREGKPFTCFWPADGYWI